MENNYDPIVKFFSEIQMLKRIKHEGWRLVGVENPDSVGEHSLVAAQIAFVLAELEGADPYKSAVICIFHDNHECRVGDHHKVAARYIDSHKGEKDADIELFGNLPEQMSQKIIELLEKKRDLSLGSKEGLIAHDADLLEMVIQAKIYKETGFLGTQNWIDNVSKMLETDSAKKILEIIDATDDFTNIWWQGLKKMTDQKNK